MGRVHLLAGREKGAESVPFWRMHGGVCLLPQPVESPQESVNTPLNRSETMISPVYSHSPVSHCNSSFTSDEGRAFSSIFPLETLRTITLVHMQSLWANYKPVLAGH